MKVIREFFSYSTERANKENPQFVVFDESQFAFLNWKNCTVQKGVRNGNGDPMNWNAVHIILIPIVFSCTLGSRPAGWLLFFKCRFDPFLSFSIPPEKINWLAPSFTQKDQNDRKENPWIALGFKVRKLYLIFSGFSLVLVLSLPRLAKKEKKNRSKINRRNYLKISFCFKLKIVQ